MTDGQTDGSASETTLNFLIKKLVGIERLLFMVEKGLLKKFRS